MAMFDVMRSPSVQILLSFADFFQNNILQIVLSGILSECQTVWIQIRFDILFAKVSSKQQKLPLARKEFVLLRYVPGNSYGHGRMVSLPNHTFS